MLQLRNQYDQEDRLTALDDSAFGTRTYHYDAEGRLLRSALERGETPPEVTLSEWRETILRHVRMAIEDKRGKHRLARPEGAPRPRAHRPNGGHEQRELDEREAELAAVRELRKHLLWYTRGRRGGLAFRRVAPDLHTEDDVKRALDRFFPEDGSVPAEVRDEAVGDRELTADD